MNCTCSGPTDDHDSFDSFRDKLAGTATRLRENDNDDDDDNASAR